MARRAPGWSQHGIDGGLTDEGVHNFYAGEFLPQPVKAHDPCRPSHFGQNARFTKIIFGSGLPVAKRLHYSLAIDPAINAKLDDGGWVTGAR